MKVCGKDNAFMAGRPFSDGTFTGMTKRRVANVVGGTGCHSESIRYHCRCGAAASVRFSASQCASRRPNDRPTLGNLDGMCQPIVNMIVRSHRMDLRLAGQPAKRRRENHAVIVGFKGRAKRIRGRSMLRLFGQWATGPVQEVCPSSAMSCLLCKCPKTKCFRFQHSTAGVYRADTPSPQKSLND